MTGIALLNSLDKELQQIGREAEVGKRLADKLFKVWQVGGEEAWVLVHIKDVVQLFRLIDWMMALPEELQRQFKEELGRYQEDNKMPLLSRIELEAKQEGIEEGLQQGILQNAREAVLTVLETRFEVVPSEVIEAVNQLEDIPLLKQLLKQAIAIPSIEEFQQVLEQSISGDLAGES